MWSTEAVDLGLDHCRIGVLRAREVEDAAHCDCRVTTGQTHFLAFETGTHAMTGSWWSIPLSTVYTMLVDHKKAEITRERQASHRRS